MEHRWGHRHEFDRMILLRAASWHVLGRIRNLSVSGAFVQCGPPARGVTRVWVDLRMGPGFSELPAHLVRATADGIGIEWGTLAPAQVVRLLTGPPPRRATVPERDWESRVRVMRAPDAAGIEARSL